MHWRRKWQPTPVFLPGESQGRGSLVGCCLWGLTETDTTEVTQQQQQHSWFTVLICAVRQNDSVIHLYILFHILFHRGLSEDTARSSLCYTVEPCRGRGGRITSLRLADANDYVQGRYTTRFCCNCHHSWSLFCSSGLLLGIWAVIFKITTVLESRKWTRVSYNMMELSFFINSQLLFLIKLSPGFCKVLFSSSVVRSWFWLIFSASFISFMEWCAFEILIPSFLLLSLQYRDFKAMYLMGA